MTGSRFETCSWFWTGSRFKTGSRVWTAVVFRQLSFLSFFDSSRFGTILVLGQLAFCDSSGFFSELSF